MVALEVPHSRRRPHAFHLLAQVRIERSREQVYRFLTSALPAHYRALARGHERFEILGGGVLREGVLVDCRERAHNQEVHHLYRVVTARAPAEIALVCPSTRAFIQLKNRVIEGSSATYVYQDLEALSPTATRLTQTVIIELPNHAKRVLAWATGSRRLWHNHLCEEVFGAKAIIEKLTDASCAAYGDDGGADAVAR